MESLVQNFQADVIFEFIPVVEEQYNSHFLITTTLLSEIFIEYFFFQQFYPLKMGNSNFPLHHTYDNGLHQYKIKKTLSKENPIEILLNIKYHDSQTLNYIFYPNGMFATNEKNETILLNNISKKPVYKIPFNLADFEKKNKVSPFSILPKPFKIEEQKEQFLKHSNKFYLENNSEFNPFLLNLFPDFIIIKEKKDLLEEELNIFTKITINLNDNNNNFSKIIIAENQIEIKIKSQEELANVCATLIQMLLLSEETLPCCTIEDNSYLNFRGLHLDISRHFFDKEQIKRILKLMALYKLNKLHLHLTDDQGWRIEISKYPELTKIGAWRGYEKDLTMLPELGDSPLKYGGFLSKSDVKELIGFAKSLGIDIIPEIDLPGHSTAMIKSIKQFSNHEGVHYLFINNDTLNTKNFEILKDIFSEIFELFSNDIVHFGGDEVMDMNFKMFENVIDGLEEFIISKGKVPAGWEEIAIHKKTDVKKVKSIVYLWKSLNPKILAECLEKGNQIVLTPGNYLYFDMGYDHDIEEPGLFWAGAVNLQQAYSFIPIPEELEKFEKQILGVQGCVWSELLTTMERFDFMVFPRIFALAETGWRKEKNWGEFLKRAMHQQKVLNRLGVNFRPFGKGWVNDINLDKCDAF